MLCAHFMLDYISATKPQKKFCLIIFYIFLQCSQSCDTGYQMREVKCLNEQQITSESCDAKYKPESKRPCNTVPCPHSNTGNFLVRQATAVVCAWIAFFFFLCKWIHSDNWWKLYDMIEILKYSAASLLRASLFREPPFIAVPPCPPWM